VHRAHAGLWGPVCVHVHDEKAIFREL